MKIMFFANSDWYLFNFRIGLAKYLRDRGHEVVMASPGGEYVKAIQRDGFRWVRVEMDRRGINPLSELMIIKRMARILADENPDILHNFTIKSVVYGGIAAKVSNIHQVVNAVAGLGYIFSNDGCLARILRPVVRGLLKFALRGRSSRLILQNPDDVDLFKRENLLSPGMIRLIKGSGVDTSRFDATGRLDNSDWPEILMACRLLWDKGVQEFADAAKIVTDSGYMAEFTLAGSPDEGNPGSVDRIDLSKWESDGYINPVGHINDMDAYIRQIDIVVLPTRYGEGVPRVLIEAAAAGLPLVATDVPGCREIVRDGENGFIVEPGDATGLARAIIRLLEDKNLRTRMGDRGRQIVLEEFDEKVVFEKTLDVYRELCPTVDNYTDISEGNI